MSESLSPAEFHAAVELRAAMRAAKAAFCRYRAACLAGNETGAKEAQKEREWCATHLGIARRNLDEALSQETP